MKRTLVVAAVMATALSACGGGGSPQRARLTVNGRAEVAAPGAPFKPVGKTAKLVVGARVRVLEGTAIVQPGDGGRIELRSASELRYDLQPFLQSGEALVEPAKRPLSIVSDNATTRVTNGATRISLKNLALTVGAYRGAPVLESGDAKVTVLALRQGVVAARGLLPDQLAPLRYDAVHTDPWDRRFLGSAIDLGEELDHLRDGFDRNLGPNQGHTPGFFQVVIPDAAKQPSFPSLFDAQVGVNPDPGENLVGSVIALRSKQGSFDDRWRSVFGFRGAGATWGLVALDQQLDDFGGLRNDVFAAVGRANLDFTLPVAQRGSSRTPITGTTPPTTRPGTTPTTQPGGSPPPTTPPTTLPITPPVTSPVTVPPPPPTGTPVDQVLDPLVDTANNLLGGG
jgi:hypothetical protein